MSRLFRSSQCHETPAWGGEWERAETTSPIPPPPWAVPRRDGFKEGKSRATDVLGNHTPLENELRQPSGKAPRWCSAGKRLFDFCMAKSWLKEKKEEQATGKANGSL